MLNPLLPQISLPNADWHFASASHTWLGGWEANCLWH
jgi:hypothetical protein